MCQFLLDSGTPLKGYQIVPFQGYGVQLLRVGDTDLVCNCRAWAAQNTISTCHVPEGVHFRAYLALERVRFVVTPLKGRGLVCSCRGWAAQNTISTFNVPEGLRFRAYHALERARFGVTPLKGCDLVSRP